MSVELQQVEPEYVYVTIPAEYICVYHRILIMLSDYGEEMLKDCKASCTDKNSGVIECFNMFNSAVAARKLGKDKLAETLIKYIKAKINQIYKGKDNSTSFIFPVDETGRLKAFVTCGERPLFEINPNDMSLYEHEFNNGFDEHFRLGPDDGYNDEPEVEDDSGLVIDFVPLFEKSSQGVVPCADLYIKYNNITVDPKDCVIEYYFDDIQVLRFNDVTNVSAGTHKFTVLVIYNNVTKVKEKSVNYVPTD